MATPPVPELSLFVKVVVRDIDGEESYPLGAPVERLEGPLMTIGGKLPGVPAVEGIKFRRGRSVGGRGAGPGFMNWPGV